MKTHLIIALAICLPVCAAMAQATNHPSIERTQVSYVPVVPANASSPEISVRSTAAVTLKAGFNATIIVLAIKDEQTMEVIYQTAYPVNSADVTANGIVLYKKDGDTLYITNPASTPLKPYIYELYTEDASETKSIVYSIIQ